IRIRTTLPALTTPTCGPLTVNQRGNLFCATRNSGEHRKSMIGLIRHKEPIQVIRTERLHALKLPGHKVCTLAYLLPFPEPPPGNRPYEFQPQVFWHLMNSGIPGQPDLIRIITHREPTAAQR